MEKQIAVFNDYANRYDHSIKNIARKHTHSLSVVKVAGEIARILQLDEKNIWLAEIIGLLHDIARFEQWTQFKTFYDENSFDHGDKACELLFKDGLIKDFEIDKKYYPVIEYAIRNHNKIRIDKSNVPAAPHGIDALLHARIIRDADKTDIFTQRIRGEGFALEAAPKKEGISPASLQALKEKRLIPNETKETTADLVLGYISWCYDLETDAAREIFAKREYPIKICETFENLLSPADKKVVREIAKKVLLVINHF